MAALFGIYGGESESRSGKLYFGEHIVCDGHAVWRVL